MNYRDRMLSKQLGHQVVSLDLDGQPMRVMIKDPTVGDNQWWRAELMKANPSEQRKSGAITIPPNALADIVIKCSYYPLDYAQVEPEISEGGDPADAGKPIFNQDDAEAILASPLDQFNKIADIWIDRMNTLFPVEATASKNSSKGYRK